MPKGKGLCLQSKSNLNSVYEYYGELEKHCIGRGALYLSGFAKRGHLAQKMNFYILRWL